MKPTSKNNRRDSRDRDYRDNHVMDDMPSTPIKDLVFSYREPDLLRKFLTPQGYIVARSRTGLSQKQQRRLTQAIKRARHLALLPFTQTL